MEGGRKVLPADTVEVAGRRTKETRKEKPKGDDRQVERRRKFISKEMWDDALDLVLTNLDLEKGTIMNGIVHAYSRCQRPVVHGLQRERFLGLGLLRAFTPLTLLTHLPYCTRPMAAEAARGVHRVAVKREQPARLLAACLRGSRTRARARARARRHLDSPYPLRTRQLEPRGSARCTRPYVKDEAVLDVLPARIIAHVTLRDRDRSFGLGSESFKSSMTFPRICMPETRGHYMDRCYGVGKWRTVKRDAQREEREDSGWRGPRQGAGERNGKQREREREGTSGNGSIESAAQRNAPPLLWSGSFAGAPPRPRASEREKENDGAGEGEMEKEGERKGLTEAEGRPTYIRRPIPT
ncbi:hypothetical protein ALC60_03088 [Trachymyrmex zeteki]|uniref:Uncharacterized protein n=1 Tax=Mycetomoellerius zeteki TaxID=64791 RepID=A0A151XCB8_9HYME|nr:hypothetical protein ALC60_03088 [Trachymyrmex zeteki]